MRVQRHLSSFVSQRPATRPALAPNSHRVMDSFRAPVRASGDEQHLPPLGMKAQDRRAALAIKVYRFIELPYRKLYELASHEPVARGIGLASWFALTGSLLLHNVLPVGLGTALFEFYTKSGLGMIAGALTLLTGIPLLSAAFYPHKKAPDMRQSTQTVDFNAPPPLRPPADIQEVENGMPHNFAYFWVRDHGAGGMVPAAITLVLGMTIARVWDFLPKGVAHLPLGNLWLIAAASFLIPMWRAVFSGDTRKTTSYPSLAASVYDLAQRQRTIAATSGVALGALLVDSLFQLTPVGQWIANWPLSLGGALSLLGLSLVVPMLQGFLRPRSDRPAPPTPNGRLFLLARSHPLMGSLALSAWIWIMESVVFHQGTFGKALADMVTSNRFAAGALAAVLFAAIPLIRGLFPELYPVRNVLFVTAPNKTDLKKNGLSLWDAAYWFGKNGGKNTILVAGSILTFVTLRFAEAGTSLKGLWALLDKDPTNLVNAALIVLGTLSFWMFAGWSQRGQKKFSPDGKTHYFTTDTFGDAAHGGQSPWRDLP